MKQNVFLLIMLLFSGLLVAQKNTSSIDTTMKEKMKIEIWSDIVCPFCYIGKARFDRALAGFEHRDRVEVVWKSFLLNPDQKTDTTISIYRSLALSKGWTDTYAKQVSSQVTEMAAQTGLTYNFDSVVVANSVRAHQLLHLAAKQGLQSQMKQQLFAAYFTDGKNIDDPAVLIDLGVKVGLAPQDIAETLNSGKFIDDINRDIKEANEIGVRGVPFFVYLGKYVISGAQDESLFANALEKAWAEFAKSAQIGSQPEVKEAAVCAPDGKCD